MVNYAREHKEPEVLRARWVVRTNNLFWKLIEQHQEGRKIQYDRVWTDWVAWFERNARYAGR